jgi:hypothetical protein
MAITIEEKPYDFTPVGQKLIYRVSSTNHDEEGFRLRVQVVPSAGDPYVFFLQKNAAEVFIFDLAPIVGSMIDQERDAYGDVHSTSQIDTFEDTSCFVPYSVSFDEFWIVSGVLTLNDGETQSHDIRVFNAYYQHSDGYKPDPDANNNTTSFSLRSTTARAWSDRAWNTHYPPTGLNLSAGTDKIFIPVKEEDYGVLYFSGRDEFLTNNDVTAYNVRIFTSGNVFTSTATISVQGLYVEGAPVYPANLNAHTNVALPKPEDYPNWKYIQVWFSNASNVRKSAFYILYNTALYGQSDCRHDRIRLAWVGSRCGWEYMNFIKKSEESNEIERKRYTKLVGDFAALGLFNKNDRGLTERTPIVQRFITINSDWIQEGEFVFLRGLFVSRQVFIVNDDGTSTPVVVADNSFVEKRDRNGKLVNVTIKLQYANNYWT